MKTANNLPDMDLPSETMLGGFCTDTIRHPKSGFAIMEEWKSINGFEGIYEASSLGRVRTLVRKINYRNRTWGGKIINGCVYKNGYVYLVLIDRKQYLLHRMIAQTFILNPENKPQVNHKNGIKTDNRIDNLEWVTNLENCLHAKKNLLLKHGEAHYLSTLNEMQVRVIRKCTDLNQAECAKIFNTSQRTVGRIRKRATWVNLK